MTITNKETGEEEIEKNSTCFINSNITRTKLMKNTFL